MERIFRYTLFIIVGMLLKVTCSCNRKIVKDIDGNAYNTVTIGTQVWMVENLKVTKYNDGTPISNVSEDTKWGNLSSAAYCWYDYEIANTATWGEWYKWYKTTYGTLYNFYTVSTGRLCPKGWHVPTDSEWTILTDYLEGESIAGGKLKETGTTHWNSPNTGATNETGFTALPGGCRLFDGRFFDCHKLSYWWSSTKNGSDIAVSRYIRWDSNGVLSYDIDKKCGFSVRCIKN